MALSQEDTVFGVAEPASAACYPGEGNLRIRWENALREFPDTPQLLI